MKGSSYTSAGSSSTSTAPAGQVTTSTSNAPKFFVDHKKGEVAELMNLLKNPSLDKDLNKKKPSLSMFRTSF